MGDLDRVVGDEDGVGDAGEEEVVGLGVHAAGDVAVERVPRAAGGVVVPRVREREPGRGRAERAAHVAAVVGPSGGVAAREERERGGLAERLGRRVALLLEEHKERVAPAPRVLERLREARRERRERLVRHAKAQRAQHVRQHERRQQPAVGAARRVARRVPHDALQQRQPPLLRRVPAPRKLLRRAQRRQPQQLVQRLLLAVVFKDSILFFAGPFVR